MSRMFDNYRWLKLVSQKLIKIDGKDYTEEVWVNCVGKSVTERIPRQREYYGK